MYRVSIVTRLLDVILPRQCPACGRRLAASEESFCAPCMLSLPRTGHASSPGDNKMCRLLWGRIPVERAVSLFHFAPKSPFANVIYKLKYGGHPEYGEELGRIAAQETLYATRQQDEGEGFFDGIDCIVPIPLARGRRLRRGYNQSEEIARGISRETGIPVERKAVCRTTFKESQTHKNWRERKENVEKVFQLKRPERIRGKHILIVDDIITSGATVCACAAELLKAGDIRISVMTLGFAGDT